MHKMALFFNVRVVVACTVRGGCECVMPVH